MSSSPRPAFLDYGKSVLRFKIAAGFLVFALALGFIAYRFQANTYITAQRTAGSNQRFDRIWFAAQNVLAGARTQGDRIKIHREAAAGVAELNIEIPAGGLVHGESSWAVAPAFDVVAWIHPGALLFRALANEKSTRTVLFAAGSRPLVVTVLGDGAIAVAFEDGVIARWNSRTGEPLPGQDLALGSVRQATAVGDYLAAGSSEKIFLYHYRDGHWAPTESVSAPAPPYRLVIPAAGSIATIEDGFLHYGGESRNTRGAVGSVVSHQGVLITAGKFDNVWVATSSNQEQEDYEVATAEPGSILATGKNQLAVSGPQGTSVFTLGSEERLTATGRMAAALASLSALISFVLALAPMLLRHLLKLFAKMLGRAGGAGGGLAAEHLPPPPTILIERIAAARSVLWAGAGLSVQSGLPTRSVFVTNLINTGSVEGWIRSDDVSSLRHMVARGQAEAAMDRLIERRGAQASIGHIRSLIPKYPTLSRCHELLSSIPFAAAMSTNYDDLLERMKSHWTAKVVTPSSAEIPSLSGIPFLLKLYGELGQSQSIRMSRSKLAADFPAPARRLLNSVGSMNTLLFIGASLEGLLADLDALGLSDIRGGTHFAVVGTPSSQWKKIAQELKGRYSIEVLACREETIATELPKFLEELLRRVNQVQRDAVEVAKVEEPDLTTTAA